MLYRWLADLVLVLHLAFVGFVVFGGLLLLRWPRLAWVHAPAALWGIVIEYAGLTCPLTPLEVALRRRGGQAGYAGDFIEHYVMAVLYPSGLTRGLQVALGTLALGINLLIYWWAWHRRRTSLYGSLANCDKIPPSGH
ncbi:MAG TPA: DUF2784 domain-containing protein [Blastocatellia bacterium]|nr:DUF2784 domain-containing protein [Blastocatellia bacterium]